LKSYKAFLMDWDKITDKTKFNFIAFKIEPTDKTILFSETKTF